MEPSQSGQAGNTETAPAVTGRERIIPNPKLMFLDQVREVMREPVRLRRYAGRTEAVYAG